MAEWRPSTSSRDLGSDWDSYGAGPIGRWVREQAKTFLRSVAKTVGLGYAHPDVGPTAEGGLTLIWRGAGQPKVQVFSSPEGCRFVVRQSRELIDKGSISDPAAGVTLLKQHLLP